MTDAPKLKVDAESMKRHREELTEIVKGNAIAEAAVEGMTDWEVVAALERLWAVGISPDP
jgi:hypothetical protein